LIVPAYYYSVLLKRPVQGSCARTLRYPVLSAPVAATKNRESTGPERYESCSSVTGKDARERIKDFSFFTFFETKNGIQSPEIEKPG
jgi:hypothetical protein